MLFTVLGPVAITVRGHTHLLPRSQRRAVLGYLLLNANRVVSPEAVAAALWADDPPPSARNQIHAGVCVVRAHLAALGHRNALVRSQAGYQLSVEPDELDLLMFEDCLRRARGIAAGGQPATAAALFRAGLELWSGPALGGAAAAYVAAARTHLDEQRLGAIEDLLDQELACGHHGEVIAELGPLIGEHPFRERLHAQLMLALYRSGRQAEALQVYRDVRRQLADELGLEPGVQLRQLEQAVLTSDPGLDLRGDPSPIQLSDADPNAPTGPRRAALVGSLPIPAQLPSAVPGFTGRGAELKRLDELAGPEPDAQSGPDPDGQGVPIVVIAGTAGVGKTALAVHWSRAVADRYPEGQLYVNLRGYDLRRPVPTGVALAGFLRALGVDPARLPTDLDEAAGLYRSLLAGRRFLVLLDNAASADQLRPLLPGEPGCLVVVTSRDRLSGLVARDGAHRLTLDLLEPDDSVRLLGRILGPQRVTAEPVAAAALAEACGRLPLALRIAAANLADHTDRSLASQVAALTRDRRLALLAVDGDESSAVRFAFQQSYVSLAAPLGRLFRLLGLVPGPDVTAESAAALAATTPVLATGLLDRLADASLLEAHGDGRYGLHDLIRLFARERAVSDESEPERTAARAGWYGYYLQTSDAAVRLLYPTRLRLLEAPDGEIQFDSRAAALAWLDSEQANLVAAAIDAADQQPVELSWLLADALRSYLWRRMSTANWKAVTTAGLAAATEAGDLRAQAAMVLGLGLLHLALGEHARAVEYNSRAVALSLTTGWQELQAIALTNLGGSYLELGWLQHAADQFQRALAVNEKLGRGSGQAMSLGNLGSVCLEQGELDRAADYLRQAVARPESASGPDGGATHRVNLGETYLSLGDLDAATEQLTAAITAAQAADRPDCQALALALLAAVDRKRGQHARALEQTTAALALVEPAGNGYDQAVILNVVGAVQLDQGQHDKAIEAHQDALRCARHADSPRPEVIALIGLADCHYQLGQADVARSRAEQAVEIAQRIGYRPLETQARQLLLSHPA